MAQHASPMSCRTLFRMDHVFLEAGTTSVWIPLATPLFVSRPVLGLRHHRW